MQSLSYFKAQEPVVGHSLLITEASRTHSDTTHSAVLLWTSDQPVADLYLKTHNNYKGQIIIGGILVLYIIYMYIYIYIYIYNKARIK
jgi:hypothetical protein